MHVDCDCTDCSVILSQGTGDAYRVVSMVGRAFTVTEQRGCLLERLLLTAAWAVRKLARFTMYLPAITVVLPHPAAVQCTCVGDGLTPRL